MSQPASPSHSAQCSTPQQTQRKCFSAHLRATADCGFLSLFSFPRRPSDTRRRACGAGCSPLVCSEREINSSCLTVEALSRVCGPGRSLFPDGCSAPSQQARGVELRLQTNAVAVSAVLVGLSAIQRERWACKRNECWFEDTLPHLGEAHFKQAFRVCVATFRYLVESCRSELQRQDTNIRNAIAVERRVAVGLYRLCSSAEECTIAHLFGIGRSTVNVAFRDFCNAVLAQLEGEWLRMISPDDMAAHMREFYAPFGSQSPAVCDDLKMSQDGSHATGNRRPDCNHCAACEVGKAQRSCKQSEKQHPNRKTPTRPSETHRPINWRTKAQDPGQNVAPKNSISMEAQIKEIIQELGPAWGQMPTWWMS
ncbi:hypothetical protein HPB48_000453 [Haemaphysalis longicornis]|uniref:Transposase Helix-turn-helix domain-containing protein n=1 Tax=Haemaphysalis longicornis TaxID=44386 RepID=A0A9J6GHB5_HAELO|nr:hypothetical protein HPB48_000453 [Haemaphysalis longicornis]